MAKKKTKFKIEGLSEAIKALDKLDKKLQIKLIKKINRKLLNPIKAKIASAAPTTPHNSWKKKTNLTVVATKGDRSSLDLGYKRNKETYMIRWHEKGTKVRTKRGRISARPWIKPTHSREVPGVIKRFRTEYSSLIETVLRTELKSVSRRLAKKTK